jgi:hypothetical protein
MASITIYGSSDDLIEIEGDIREEFCVDGDDSFLLGISDGTLLNATYDREGMWRINRLKEGSAGYDKVEGKDPDDDYTDQVTLTGDDIEWVIGGSHWARRRND